MNKEIIVISLGGSVVVPDKIDKDFLLRFSEIIKQNTDRYKFIIVVGGGKTAREYINSAPITISNDVKDMIGIRATQLNAMLVKSFFEEYSEEDIIINPTAKIQFKKDVLLAGGWKPGFSTDYDAVLLAKNFDCKTVINMTNVDFLYDKNPKEHNDAKAIKAISWDGFKTIVGDKWAPGLNSPFDPVATKEASNLGLKLVLIGKDLDNFLNFLLKKQYSGSVVE